MLALYKTALCCFYQQYSSPGPLMGDPGALASAMELSSTTEETAILNFLRNKPCHKAEMLKYIGVTSNSTPTTSAAGNHQMPLSDDLTTTAPGFYLLSSLSKSPTKNTPLVSTPPVNNNLQPQGGLKRQRSPETVATVTQSPRVQNQSQHQAIPSEPGDKRLTVILGSSLPTALRKDRNELINAVKFAAPAGVKLGEIKLTRNDDILISCLTPHDHNACLRSDKWTQNPHSFIPRFNLSATNNDIVYIKSVPLEIDITIFDELLKGKKINFSNLERVKTGKTRQDSLTLRLLIHDKGHKERLVKEGILHDHRKYNLELHVKTAIKQCYRCLEFGHFISDCTGSDCCTRCGGPHRHGECTVDRESPTCANCFKDEKISAEDKKHAASDRGCPTRIRLLREARKVGLKNIKPTSTLTSGRQSNPGLVSCTDFPPLTHTNRTTSSAAPPAASSPNPHPYVTNRIFGEEIIEPVSLDKAVDDKKELVTEILGVVADALDEILKEIPSINRKKIGDSFLRSVGRISDKYIDIAAVARRVIKNPPNTTRFTATNTTINHQSAPQQSGWSRVFSNQVIDDALKRPYPAPPISQQTINPPEPKRLNKSKRNPQVQPRKRADSETSFLSESSSRPTIHSTPAGQRLSSARVISPLLGRKGAPSSPTSSPTSSILSSPGTEFFSIRFSGEDSLESSTVAASPSMNTSLIHLLQATDQQLAAPPATNGPTVQKFCAVSSTPASTAPPPAPVQNLGGVLSTKPLTPKLTRNAKKKKDLQPDSKQDG